MGILDDAFGPSSTLPQDPRVNLDGSRAGGPRRGGTVRERRAAAQRRGDISNYTGNGPLASLDTNKYYDPDTQTLSYPRDIAAGSVLYPHFIKFNINQPSKSRYKSKIDNTGGGLSTADLNRASFNQLAGAPIGVAGSAGAGIAAGAIVGVTELTTDLAKIAQRGDKRENILGEIDAATNLKNAGTSALAIGAGAGVLASVVTSQVDLTRKTKRLIQTINLYMPDEIVSQTQNKYGEVSMTAALGAAGLGANMGKSAAGALEGILGDVASLNIEQAANKVKNAATALGPAGVETQASVLGAAGKKLGVFGEGIENVLLQSYGYAQNPQIEILFDTTDMRQFIFTFNFLPRNSDESLEVMKIIRMFRFHAAPEIPETFSGRYYIPPSEFDIKYMFMQGDGTIIENPALHKFSTCVLENIDVNYVGESGQFTTFRDGHPVHIVLRLSFKEIEVIHKELIRNGY